MDKKRKGWIYHSKKYTTLKVKSKEKSWVLPIICSKCGNDNDGIFREEENIDILKILGLIGNGYY